MITVYHNKDCARCARIARTHKRFDWRDRVYISTDTPPRSRPLQLGEIAVEDMETHTLVQGVDAVRRIFAEIPMYLPLRPLLRIPMIARKIDRDVRGCDGDSCIIG